jgi:hypothetical protein
MDPDTDPGGPKTCGSGGSGSGTLVGLDIYLFFTLPFTLVTTIVVDQDSLKSDPDKNPAFQVTPDTDPVRDPDTDPGLLQKILEKTAEIFIFWIKNCNFLIARPPYRSKIAISLLLGLHTGKLQEKPSAFLREHPARMKFITCFLIFPGHF